MSGKTTNTKKQKTTSFNLSSISGVLNLILAAFSIPEPPIAPLPPPLIFLGGKLRPGLSAMAIASRIISRQSEAGLPVGNSFADGPNTSEIMKVIEIEEIINAFQNEAVVNVAIDPGIPIAAIGIGNLGIPIISQGQTVSLGVGNGIIR